MSNLLLPFNELQNPNCICADLLDPEDIACYGLGGGHGKYQFLDESSPLVPRALADCQGLGFGTIRAKSLTTAHDLPGFVPVVTRGSNKLFESFTPPYVGVMIHDIITDKLKVYPDIRKRMGIPAATKIILLAYGLDELIENIWPRHRQVFQQLLQSGIDLIAPINFSIWHNHPHLERLINVKRSLVVYETLQDLGFEAVPHMYFSGKADLGRWAQWLGDNPCVKMVAIDLQTIGSNERALWCKTVEELAYFSTLLDRPLHYLISGPQTPGRVSDIFRALGPNVTLTNGRAAILASNYKGLTPTYSGLRVVSSAASNQSDLFADNCEQYAMLFSQQRQPYLEGTILRSLGGELKGADLERLYAQFKQRRQKVITPSPKVLHHTLAKR